MKTLVIRNVEFNFGLGAAAVATSPGIVPDGGEKCRIIYICISFLRAVVVVLVVSVIILIHFVVVIFSLRMYAQQVFSALFTGVLNIIACDHHKMNQNDD